MRLSICTIAATLSTSTLAAPTVKLDSVGKSPAKSQSTIVRRGGDDGKYFHEPGYVSSSPIGGNHLILTTCTAVIIHSATTISATFTVSSQMRSEEIHKSTWYAPTWTSSAPTISIRGLPMAHYWVGGGMARYKTLLAERFLVLTNAATTMGLRPRHSSQRRNPPPSRRSLQPNKLFLHLRQRTSETYLPP